MKYGTRTGSIIGENISAHNPESEKNLNIMRRKVMCWVCQKEKRSFEGKTSFLIRPHGERLSDTNNLRKFVCFACKPEKKDESA